MTAPRTCRSCGSDLSPDVRWCGLCKEPVREFATRPTTREGFVADIAPRVRTSRWRASPLTFGPVGRLVVSAIVMLVLLMGTSQTGWWTPFGLWFFMGWFILASLVLRQTWQPVPIEDAERWLPARLRGRFPRMTAPVNASLVIVTVAVLTMLGVAVAWVRLDTLGRFGLVVVFVLLGASALLVWLTGV
jgi:hypothetical protein